MLPQKPPDSIPVGITCPESVVESSGKPQQTGENDCHPFGMQMRERSYDHTGMGYRFGFNQKELDPEGMGGGGSTYDYGFRIYNPQIARFLSVDPLFQSFPWNSVYSYAENDVIRSVDLDGLERIIYNYVADNNGKAKLKLPNYVFINENKQKTNGPLGSGSLTIFHNLDSRTSSVNYTFLKNNEIFTINIGTLPWANDNQENAGSSILKFLESFERNGSYNASQFEDWVIRNCDPNVVNDFIEAFGESRGIYFNSMKKGSGYTVIPGTPDNQDGDSEVIFSNSGKIRRNSSDNERSKLTITKHGSNTFGYTLEKDGFMLDQQTHKTRAWLNQQIESDYFDKVFDTLEIKIE